MKKGIYSILAGVLAGEGSAMVAGTLNDYVNKNVGIYWTAGIFAPMIEEILKSGLAESIQGDVLFSHLTFGSSEGLVYFNSRGATEFDFRRSVLHACFGALYLLGLETFKSKQNALILSIMAHMAWNLYQLSKLSARDTAIYGGLDKFDYTWQELKNKILI